jgi:type II restriction/modification system DNA methylase subunit YeeA
MTSKEIEANLEKLIANLNNEEFIYDLLLAYGISKTSVNRLKKGDFNLSKISGEVLYKGKVFFTTSTGELNLKVEEFAKEDRVLKQNPRFVIVTDYKTLVAKDLKSKVGRDFPIQDLPKYFDFFLPLSGAEIYKSSNDNKADRDAAYKMAQLYDILVQDNPHFAADSHKLNIFLSRLLFCFFAEDTGIFEKASVFTETLSQHTNVSGADVHEFLNTFFKRLNTKSGNFPDYLQKQFPYVNGGLFRDNIQSPIFSAKARALLLSCGDLDWSEINPDIFGSMIQAVADPEERSDLGMHYTSVPNIKKLIEPLFLDALNEDFEKQQQNINGLKKLIFRLSQIKFFDPACGSGNFLIITYKEIRLLEIQIIKRIIELSSKQGLTIPLQFTDIKLSQFYGIEIKDFAHEMAILSLWLAEHQMNKVFDDVLEGFGQSKPILPLKEAGNIICGNATRLDWTDVCPRTLFDEAYILGNPPYLGARIQDEKQKEDMDYVFKSYAKYKDLDYISIWFYKGARYIEGHNAQMAFVSTNSICQGQQVALLWDKVLKNTLEISFSHTSFKWINNAKGNAGVTVIIVGLRNIVSKEKYLFTESIKQEVKNINAYLLDAPNIIISERMKSIAGFMKMNFGNMPNDGGGLILDETEKQILISKLPDANKFLKPLVGSTEFINGISRYCLWIEDDELEQALSYVELSNKIELCKQHRLKSKDKGTNALASRSHQFRDRNVALESAIIIPRVSSARRRYIPLDFLTSGSIILDSAMAIYDAQPWLFGILHSKMHMVWVNAVGGKLKTDYRYSAKLCYNTFPFPEINLKQKESITQYVFDILDERAKYSEKTMAWMYNPDTMPVDLEQAHKALDDAIERIYRLAPFTKDAERLAHLFKLYEEMTKKDTLFAKPKQEKKTKTK